jgi:hypothetical protein
MQARETRRTGCLKHTAEVLEKLKKLPVFNIPEGPQNRVHKSLFSAHTHTPTTPKSSKFRSSKFSRQIFLLIAQTLLSSSG